MKPRERRAALQPSLIAISVAACFAAAPYDASANPTGPTVASGSAAFATAGSTLTITNSANAIINWQGFSIGVNEITRFLQSSAGSAVLNRVIGSGGAIPQSVIEGALQSNGRVFLLNPAGIVVGSGAHIDVAGLVMSSLNLSDQDFLNGRLRFTEVPGAGGISNQGAITTASGGHVYLVAPSVENSGIIRAPQGDILLAAGKSAELVSDGSPLVSVKVTADSEQALNVGSLIADSGRIGMFGALVRNSGVAEAGGAVMGAGGSIRFVATKDLTLDAGSRTAASGTSGGDIVLQAQTGTNLIAGTVEAKGSAGTGGSVQALGVRVGVIGSGVIDASGDAGGGTVLIGGDTHGANPDIQNAQQTYIGSNGVIRADAGTTGDGGRVVVWSDGDTRFFGSITARGGSQSGNGGFVETSGKQSLTAAGSVNTNAPNGQGGTWLLDPTDLTITSGANTTGQDDGSVNVDGLFAYTEGNNPSFITNGAIVQGMYGNGSVQLQATHDILFSASVDTSAYAGSFIVRANNNIDLYHNNITTKGFVVLNANSGAFGTPSGTGAVLNSGTGPGGNITTYGGSVGMAAASITVGDINTTGGTSSDTSVSLTATSGSIATGTITTGASSLTSNVVLAATDGGITTGAITTGAATGANANTLVWLRTMNSIPLVFTGGSISTGAITTGNASGGNTASWILMSAYGGAGISTGNLQTGSADFGNVLIASYGGGVGTGSITTGATTNDSSIAISAQGGNISTGDLTTADGSFDARVTIGCVSSCVSETVSTGAITTGTYGGFPGSVSITAGGGITVNGPITTAALGGANDSSVILGTNNGDVTVNGAITTGDALLDSSVTLYTTTGNLTTGAITAGATLDDNSFVFLHAVTGNIAVNGAINTGLAGGSGDTSVQIHTQAGSITITGAITTGDASTYSYVSINSMSGGDIATGSITTGVSDDSQINVDAGLGSATTTGSVQTGVAFNSGVSYYGQTGITITGGITTQGNNNAGIGIDAPGGAVSVGNIVTSAPAVNHYVVITSGGGTFGVGGITTGSITTDSTNPIYSAGSVELSTVYGNILVQGNIEARGTNGSSVDFIDGTGSGVVSIVRSDTATAGNVTVNGSILAYGGNAYPSSYGGGGSGESVWIYGGLPLAEGLPTPPVNGDVVVTGSIDTHGGAGGSPGLGSGNAGFGGSGGFVFILASGNVTTGNISSYGGNGGTGDSFFNDHSGGSGGGITVSGTTVTLGGVNTAGGVGGDGGEGSFGSSGGSVFITAAGPVLVDSIDAHAGRAGNADPTATCCISPSGGDGGSVVIYGGSISIPNGIVAYGGDGGLSPIFYSGGSGGSGGKIYLDGGAGDVSVGAAISAFAGKGGAGADADGSFIFNGEPGGRGGFAWGVAIYGGSISTGAILAYGGAGGAGGAGNTGVGGRGGDGDEGGRIGLFASSTTIGVTGTIDASGGAGGQGGAGDAVNASGAGGDGKSGAADSAITLSAPGVITFADIYAYGGDGGKGGDSAGGGAGNGGNGGFAGAVAAYGGFISATGQILAYGGGGGQGGVGDSVNAGGAGGNGSNASNGLYPNLVTLSAPGGTIGFTGDINVSGGAAGAGGLDGGGGGVGLPGPAAGVAGVVSMNGVSIAWVADSPANYSINASSLFNWRPLTFTNAISLDSTFFTGIAAPLIRIGGGIQSGAITVAGPIALGAESLSLVTNGGAITQVYGGTISAAGLNAYGGSVTLNEPNNVGTLQGSATGGSFAFQNAGALDIRAVDSSVILGVGASGAVTVGAAGPLSVTFGVGANGAVTLDSGSTLTTTGQVLSTGGSITLNAGGTIAASGPMTGSSLSATTIAGDIVIVNPNNSIPVLSASAPGDVTVMNGVPASLMSVASASGNNVSLISDQILFSGAVSGATSVSYNNTSGGTLSFAGSFLNNVTTPLMRVGSTSNSGDITLLGAVAPAHVGALSLVTGLGTVSASGGITATALNAQGAVVNLSGPNSVGTIQARATGGDVFYNGTGSVNIGTVDAAANPTAGISASGIATVMSGGDITSSIAAGFAVQGAGGVVLSAPHGLIGGAAPLEVAGPGLSADAMNGINIDLNQFAPRPAGIGTLANTGPGDIVLNAWGGAATSTLVSNPGGNVSITTHSPLDVLAGIDAGNSIFLAALGGGSNAMTLNGPFSYNKLTGTFQVTIDVGGKLTLVATKDVLTAELFPNAVDITKFIFLGPVASELTPTVITVINNQTGFKSCKG